MTALERTLAETRALPARIALTSTDLENLEAVRDAWNADRVRRGAFPLSSLDVLRIGLETAAAWLAGKET